MKKLHKLISAVSLGLTFLFSTSCYNEVFYNISKDVPPEDASIIGPINSIARYAVNGKEFLVTYSEGAIRYKPVDKDNRRDNTINTGTGNLSNASSWNTYAIPSDVFTTHKYDYYGTSGTMGHNGQQIIKVLADSEKLYIVTVEYTLNSNEGISVPKKLHLWAVKIPSLEENGEKWKSTSSKDEWKDLNADSDYLPVFTTGVYYYSAFNVFGTNSIKPENRKVYVRRGTSSEYAENDCRTYRIYEVKQDHLDEDILDSKGNSIEKIEIFEASDKMPADDRISSDITDPKNANSVVIFNGKPLFFNSMASISNETSTEDASIVYFSKGNALYYYKNNSVTKVSNTAPNSISCFALTKDSLLIGCADFTNSTTSSGGLCKAILSDGIPQNITTQFTTNATTQIPSVYLIYTLLSTDPNKTETASSLYTSIGFITSGTSSQVSYENIGLWAYYPSRGNWNRE